MAGSFPVQPAPRVSSNQPVVAFVNVSRAWPLSHVLPMGGVHSYRHARPPSIVRTTAPLWPSTYPF